jgi:hypothetical protein
MNANPPSKLDSINKLVGLLVTAWLFLMMVDGDGRMRKSARAIGMAQWYALRRWWRRETNPDWVSLGHYAQQELRNHYPELFAERKSEL